MTRKSNDIISIPFSWIWKSVSELCQTPAYLRIAKPESVACWNPLTTVYSALCGPSLQTLDLTGLDKCRNDSDSLQLGSQRDSNPRIKANQVFVPYVFNFLISNDMSNKGSTLLKGYCRSAQITWGRGIHHSAHFVIWLSRKTFPTNFYFSLNPIRKFHEL